MGMIGKNRRMAVLFLLAFRFVRLLLSGHQGVALENAALRMQIAAFQRKRKRPLLTHSGDSTAPQSPWQNPYAERLIGSIRRECLNHYVILNASHLERTLSCYFRYYHQSRTHLSLGKQCPFPREALKFGKIVAIPQLGGRHHRYERIA